MLTAHAGGATAAGLAGETGPPVSGTVRGARHFAKMIPQAGQSVAPSGTSVEQRGQVIGGCRGNVSCSGRGLCGLARTD